MAVSASPIAAGQSRFVAPSAGLSWRVVRAVARSGRDLRCEATCPPLQFASSQGRSAGCSAPRMHPQMQFSDLRGCGARVQGVQNSARVVPDLGSPRRVVNDDHEAPCVKPIGARVSRNRIADGVRPALREIDCPAPRTEACSDRAQRIGDRSKFAPSGLVSPPAHFPHMLARRLSGDAQGETGA